MRRPRAAAAAAGLLVLSAAGVALAAPLGGEVVDGTTLKPVVGATVTAPDGTTAVTDKAGHFHFDDLAPGPLTLGVAARGYDDSTEDVTQTDGGIVDAVIVLYAPGAAGEIVNVEDQAPVPPPPGKQDLRREEIAVIPGTRGDALQSIKSLPGVAQGGPPGFLIIRGSAPLDSKVTIDGIEVPIIYHFFGLQSVLPTEFIDNIEFIPGGFGAEQGRAIGGVVNVTTRSDAVDEAKGFVESSFINVAGLVTAPISKEHHLQFSVAARRSVIDFILPLVLSGSKVSFTTAPTYYDAQLRVDWRPRESDRISLLGLLDYDELSLLNDNLDPNEPSLTHAVFKNITSFTRAIATWQHAAGGLDNRLVGSVGTQLFEFDIATNYLNLPDKLAEIRDDVAYKVAPQLKLRAGLDARWESSDVKVKFPQAPAEGEPPPMNFETLPLVTYEKKVGQSVSAAYAAADLRPTGSTTLTAGLRLDHYYHIDRSTLSPRLQLTQDVGPRWTLRAAMGRYSQPLQQAEAVPTNLDPELATQYVVGADYKVKDGVTASVSGFYTDRRRIVVRDPILAQTDPLDSYVNRGYGRSFGTEVLVRARLDHFFGWIAYTLSRADRIAQPLGPRYLFDFDQTHNFIALGSYTWGRWQFGARWQYATGTPMTPVIGSTYLSDVNIYLPVYGALNSERMEAAHQLDVRVDCKLHTRHVELSLFLDVQNAYAHAQVLGYNYNYDYTQRKPTTALPILPAIGIRGTF